MMENSTQDTVPLTPADVSFIAELQMQIQTALRLIIRQRGLVGNWALDGDKLVRQ
jgi:hypothetical protein